MEEAFTKECVKLMKQDVGTISSADETNVDSLCITSYGVHFVMYVEDVAAYDISNPNAAYIQYTDKVNSGAENLTHKKLNPLTGETYFDMLFDLVYPASGDEEVFLSDTGYSDFEKQLIEYAQEIYKLDVKQTKLEGTKSSI